MRQKQKDCNGEVICYLLFVIGKLHAQDTLQNNYSENVSIDKRYFKSYFTDTKDIIVAPFHWSGKQFLTAGAVLTSTAILFTQDKTIHDVFQKNKNSATDNFSKYGFEPWGNNYAIGLITGFYFQGLIFKNERSKKVAMESTEAVFITSGCTLVTKFLVQRHRPYQDDPPDPYKAESFFKGSLNYSSFFSGHTSITFSAATIFSMEYKEKKWIPYVAYAIATGTALSRINDNEHWASDVFAGAVSGYFISRLIHKKNNWGIKAVSSQWW